MAEESHPRAVVRQHLRLQHGRATRVLLWLGSAWLMDMAASAWALVHWQDHAAPAGAVVVHTLSGLILGISVARAMQMREATQHALTFLERTEA